MKKGTQGLDVVVAGLAVVDIIGKPVDLRRPPKVGGLQLIDHLTMSTGGNVSNVGIDLAKLGFRVGVITRVGDDGLGQFLKSEYTSHGIDTSGLVIDGKKQTSATIVSVNKSGERTFLHTRGCMANFSDRDVVEHMPLIGKAQWLVFGYLGLLPQMESGLGRMLATVKQKTGVMVFLDTGGRPRRLTPAQFKSLACGVDCFIPSFEEAVCLTGKKTPEAIANAILSSGFVETAGVKLGSKGCFVATRAGKRYVPANKRVQVVDTTGAGDAFAAGFVGARIRGYDVFHSAKIANAVAAASVTAIGASTAIGPFAQYQDK